MPLERKQTDGFQFSYNCLLWSGKARDLPAAIASLGHEQTTLKKLLLQKLH